MPFVNIRITKENGEPTSEQKQAYRRSDRFTR